MSLDIHIINKALYDWLSDILDAEIIFDMPNIPRPKTPYVVIAFLGGTAKIGSSDIINYISEDNYSIEGQRTIAVSIKAVGKNAMQMLIDVQMSTEIPAYQELLRRAGLAFWNVGDVLDISELLETGYEERANIDITFGIVDRTESRVGYVDTAVGTGSITISNNSEKDFNF